MSGYTEVCFISNCTEAGDAGHGLCSQHLDRFRAACAAGEGDPAKIVAIFEATCEPQSPMPTSLNRHGAPAAPKTKPARRCTQPCPPCSVYPKRHKYLGGSTVCACGFDFATGQMAQSSRQPWEYEPTPKQEAELAAVYGGSFGHPL